jgi:hypothetical protein
MLGKLLPDYYQTIWHHNPEDSHLQKISVDEKDNLNTEL